MSTAISKLQMSVAACGIAAVTVISPAAVAQADPIAPMPMTGLGTSALVSCDPLSSPSCTNFATPFVNNSLTLSALSPSSILQNRLFWFGTPNPTPPPRTTVFEFYPLALIPGFIRPLFGWFENVNFEACVGGLTFQIGPYGTVSGSYGRGCA